MAYKYYFSVKFNNSHGFIMAATLGILTVIVILSGFFTLWVEKMLEQTHKINDDLNGRLDMISTESVLFYLISTQLRNNAGITIPEINTDLQEKTDSNEKTDPFDEPITIYGNEISLDDTAYKGIGKAMFSIQDEAGLLILDEFVSPYIDTLLGILGIPSDKRGPLLDKLWDYIDTDKLNRLNGAEEGDYEKEGREGPPNRNLLTTWECKNILDWDKYPQLWQEKNFARFTTIFRKGIPNFNTAPETVLTTIPGVDDESAARIIYARKKKVFLNINEIYIAAGKNLKIDPFDISLFPSPYLRITFWYDKSSYIKELHLKLTPQADKMKPWQIEYELNIPILKELKNATIHQIPISFFTDKISSGIKK